LKLLAIGLAAAAAFQPPAFPASGQANVAGVWDGTLGNQPIRVCFNEKDWGTVGAYYYRSHLQAIPLQQPDEKNATFVEGDSAKAPTWTFDKTEANAITGQWSQGARKLPLKLSRVPGLRLKDDESPCGSMLFQGPRIDGVRVISKPAIKDGMHYTRLILDHRRHFGDSTNVETFAAAGGGPAVRKINAKLHEPLAGDPPEWLECERSAWNYGTGGADNYESYEPRMSTRRWLGVLHHWDGYCGGAHPDASNTPMLFDRETGQQVDVFGWFNAKAVERQNVDGTILNKIQPEFRDFVLSSWKPEDTDCGDAIRSEDYWDVELTRTGFVFTPELPHVVQACTEEFSVSFAISRPWLGEEGRKEIAVLEAEVTSRR
jgi:hypothetical protein